MGQVELRYRGDLLGFHPSQEAAEEHAKKHHGPGAPEDVRVQDLNSLTIEPRRPVSLFQRGSLVDTYMTEADATEARDKRIASWKPAFRGAKPFTTKDFAIVTGTEPPPVADAVGESA